MLPVSMSLDAAGMVETSPQLAPASSLRYTREAASTEKNSPAVTLLSQTATNEEPGTVSDGVHDEPPSWLENSELEPATIAQRRAGSPDLTWIATMAPLAPGMHFSTQIGASAEERRPAADAAPGTSAVSSSSVVAAATPAFTMRPVPLFTADLPFRRAQSTFW